ncbi:MAG TPA: glycoside hydrolase family 9 protein [Anseongella sp.]|nr:glycoside hydrolase family 9 protein [Anseongella sp.]
MTTVKCLLAGFLLSCTFLQAKVQDLSGDIRLNQIGFYPDAPKIAVIPGDAGDRFYVTTPDFRDTVFSGVAGPPRSAAFSSGTTRTADFSSLRSEGTFLLCIPGKGHSFPFDIRGNVYGEIAKAALKGFYYQRVSTELLPAYAGKWARLAGHPDTAVLVHASAASLRRPEGTVIASPGGWYDAGDYNKYVVNSGITTGTLLSLYEDFPAYFKAQNIHIPESRNKLPDLLDEVLWNLRWMLSMQDPDDGGVYHKLTAAEFEKMVMPASARSARYVVQKSTAATLDFAAVTAQAARVFGGFARELPGLSDSCMQAAVKAWEWALKNPGRIYNQEEMNREYDPDVSTGAYGDGYVGDEFIWAAAELYISTGDERYYEAVDLFPDDKMPVPTWSQVRLLGYYSLLRCEERLSPQGQKALATLKKRLTGMAGSWVEQAENAPYRTVMGLSPGDFVWGSNAVAANQGIALIQAYLISADKRFLRYALANLDYLLGRNATGYSFLTGFGGKTPMHPHHRPSVADGISEPVPGLLAGGPNPGMQDDCVYPSAAAGEAYTDSDCSYASNEIAINWNAPFVYLVSALEILQGELL